MGSFKYQLIAFLADMAALEQTKRNLLLRLGQSATNLIIPITPDICLLNVANSWIMQACRRCP